MTTPNPSKKPFYANPTAQVLFAIVAAIVLGYLRPATAIAMKPLGDGFIRLITMIITLIIFCTVVTGIAGMEDMKKVGRVGGKALIYFEVVSTLALIIGLLVGQLIANPGSGFNVNPATLDAKAVADYAGPGQSAERFGIYHAHHSQHCGGRVCQGRHPAGVADLNFVWLRVVGGWAALQAAVGFVRCADTCGIRRGQDRDALAPIGAFGAMAFTVGKYGLASLGPLVKLIGTFYLTSILFVLLVLGHHLPRLRDSAFSNFSLTSRKKLCWCWR